MNFSFHADAEQEFIQAVNYYEDCESSLGHDFSHEVYRTIQNIVDFPTLWPKIGTSVRRCLLHRFPYGVIYSIEPREIYILAVMNLHKDPDYWMRRQ